MTLLGTVSLAKYGRLQARHAYYATVTGPDDDVTIANGNTWDFVVSFKESPRNAYAMGLESVFGLPSGVYISNISVDKTAKTITITLYNGSGADVTIPAKSLSVNMVVLS